MSDDRIHNSMFDIHEYLFRSDGALAARGGVLMKIPSKSMWERFATASKIDRIPLIDAC
jgi:hypothetical protein